MPTGPFSICSVVPPDGRGVVSILFWDKGVVVWSPGCPDCRVRPDDPAKLWVTPGIGISLFPITLSWSKQCPRCLPTALGSPPLSPLFRFDEDLNEDVFIFFPFVEDVKLAIETGGLAGNEPGTFFRGKDRQGVFSGDVSGVASIDRRLK